MVKYSDMAAVLIVFLVCVMVSVGSLFLSRRDDQSARLTRRAETAIEEQNTASTLVSKNVCLELLVDARTTWQDGVVIYQSGLRWIVYLNAIAAFLSFLVIVRMVKARGRQSRE